MKDQKLQYAINRTKRAMQYGKDMESSRLLCIDDALNLLNKAEINSATINLRNELIQFKTNPTKQRVFLRIAVGFAEGFLAGGNNDN